MQNYLTSLSTVDFTDFGKQLSDKKQAIDSELTKITNLLLSDTAEQFGEMPKEVVQAYANVLMNGGKRIRGALAMTGYEMFGGTDESVIVQAACALEMLNTYILIADDIQDRSKTRRGGKTAHIELRDYHLAHHLEGDSEHFGEALAMNSFLIAQHYAANIIATLPIDAEVRLKALQNINKCFIVTAHGQTMDLFVESCGTASMKDVNNILEWKTAYYTFVNPLQLGAILAGAPDSEMIKLAEDGVHAGRTFQLTDDIIGTFGDETITGKSSLDDIKEGKRTLMVMYALAHASQTDAYFLESCLGNQRLTKRQFERCQSIIKATSAFDYTHKQAAESAYLAIKVVQAEMGWSTAPSHFLIDLANYLLVRKS